MASQSEREQSLGAAWTPTSFMSWWKQERTRCLSYQVVWAEEDTDARPEMSLSFTAWDAASVSQSLRRHKATAPWQQGFLALRENGSVQLRGSGRFLVCRSSADDHISSVVTNVITHGCQRSIQAQAEESCSVSGLLFPCRSCRGQRKSIWELPVWETSPLLAHPPDWWCGELSASSETDTVHVVNHETTQQQHNRGWVVFIASHRPPQW